MLNKIPYMGNLSDLAQSGLRSTVKGREKRKKAKELIQYKENDEFFKHEYWDKFFENPIPFKIAS